MTVGYSGRDRHGFRVSHPGATKEKKILAGISNFCVHNLMSHGE